MEYRRGLSEAVTWLDQHAHPADRARVAGELAAAVEARRPYQFVYRLGPEPWSWVNDSGEISPDGSRPRAEDTRLEDLVLTGSVRPVADLSREAKELAAKVSELRRMIEHAGDAALFRGNYRTLQYDYVSPSIERIFGFTPDELIAMGQPGLAARLHPDDLARLGSLLGELFARGGGPYSIEYRVTAKDGTTRHVSENGTAFVDAAGVPLYAIGAVRDVTAQKRQDEERHKLEEQLRHAQRIESLGTLTGGIAHDFNNLLAGILGHAELLKLRPDDAVTRAKAIRVILEAGLRARDLVRQILTFSRQQPPQRVPVRAGMVVNEVLHLLRGSLPARVTIVCQGEALELRVHGDPTQLHQLLMNLAVNGAQAMPNGGRLGLEAAACEVTDPAAVPLAVGTLEAGSYVRFVVEDTGSGMSEDVLDRMFEPFFTTKGPNQGTGLGLSVVHGIVLGHRGALAVQSAVGRGTRFEVFLPVWTEAPVPDEGQGAIEGGRRGERVLVVDDEPFLVSLAEQLLTELGYEVVGVDSPADALARLWADQHGFWAVLTDLNMPVMSGLVLARYVVEMTPHVPVVLVTGYLDEVTSEGLSEAGVVAVVSKPYTLAELQVALAEVRARRGIRGRSADS